MNEEEKQERIEKVDLWNINLRDVDTKHLTLATPFMLLAVAGVFISNFLDVVIITFTETCEKILRRGLSK